LSPMTVGFFAKPTGADKTFAKQLGFADFYFGTKRYPHKLGLLQSLPVPAPRMIAKTLSKRLPLPFIQFLRARMVPFVGIVEDLPNPANQEGLNPQGQQSVRHRFGEYGLARGHKLGACMAPILKKAGALYCATKAFPCEEHVAHQCGTLRFGSDAAHAVL